MKESLRRPCLGWWRVKHWTERWSARGPYAVGENRLCLQTRGPLVEKGRTVEGESPTHPPTARPKAVDNGDIPRHFTARRTKFRCMQSPKCKWRIRVREVILGQKNRNRRAVWPLREGKEIWGADGAFASISWRRECVRDSVAPSANELAWFYKGFRQSACPGAFPKRETYSTAMQLLNHRWRNRLVSHDSKL